MKSIKFSSWSCGAMTFFIVFTRGFLHFLNLNFLNNSRILISLIWQIYNCKINLSTLLLLFQRFNARTHVFTVTDRNKKKLIWKPFFCRSRESYEDDVSWGSSVFVSRTCTAVAEIPEVNHGYVIYIYNANNWSREFLNCKLRKVFLWRIFLLIHQKGFNLMLKLILLLSVNKSIIFI